MIFVPLEIDGAFLIDIEPLGDERGFFARSWCHEEFARRGLATEVRQTNIAYTSRRGTLRGLHYQAFPHEEAKLVRCTRGAAYAVALDLRPGSRSQARWVAAELTAENRRAMYVPPGCAQGYQTLADETEIYYQMSQAYVPQAARGVRFDDPAFALRWPLDVTVISGKDRSWPDYPRVEGRGHEARRVGGRDAPTACGVCLL
jgi:dTDP-4-dehydrorhamnose 3,5-epimerase